MAELQPTDTVLDLGCGVGWNTHLAAPSCHYAISVDISGRSCVHAVRGAAHQQLSNVAFAKADITSFNTLRHGIQTARNWTNLVLKLPHLTPGSTYQGPTANVPHPTPIQFNVVFICWVIQLLEPDRRRTLLTMIRNHFLLPDGRIVLTWPSPSTYGATLGIAYRITPTPAPPRDTVKLALKEYIAHENDERLAQDELNQIAHALRLRVTTHQFPPWQEMGMADKRPGILRAAQALSRTDQPVHQWLQQARADRYHSLEVRLNTMPTNTTGFPEDVREYRRVRLALQPGEDIDTMAQSSNTEVLAILTRKKRR
ncbi:uncharacterized protein PV07_12819 [Cladophialophora immunda]|uniref:Methyltransferase domain-containing protein n=1 Tax=Cladophialophora immunda TaxID=569365 RepID=A0A0D1Z244_9EURO|nr:uncharacterized protein PV07_12819 [Cladophialophora immunda]KIW21751.1 hypothetical protein PV07_12819 [Cladophialophora immunda]